MRAEDLTSKAAIHRREKNNIVQGGVVFIQAVGAKSAREWVDSLLMLQRVNL